MEGLKPEQPNPIFTPEQLAEIEAKRKLLSSLAYFIGKDFEIPVLLNEPGAGWHWDFEKNIIRIDPKDLLEKPMDYLRFVISHEAGHRRVSRPAQVIDQETWREPGFSFMFNAVDDCRDNNFVAESYPKFREQMSLAYQSDLDFEQKAKAEAKDKLGFQPRFMQAGFEYIKQWFRETEGQDFELSPDLPEDVKAVVTSTLEAAQDSWRRFPTREMADGRKPDELGLTGEESITAHARQSYEINRDQVWPEFKKLVEADLEDQKMEEAIKDKEGLPEEIKDQLPSLAEGDTPIPLESLPPEVKQKIKDYIESLPEDKQQEIAEKAEAALKEFEKALGEELRGKLVENPEQKAAREASAKPEPLEPEPVQPSEESNQEKRQKEKQEKKALADLRESIRKIHEQNQTEYDQAIKEVAPIINELEAHLRNLFRERRARAFESGKKSGPKINIAKRIKETAKEVPAFKSRAWERRNKPVVRA